jgi:hypothetical protein
MLLNILHPSTAYQKGGGGELRAKSAGAQPTLGEGLSYYSAKKGLVNGLNVDGIDDGLQLFHPMLLD